ncbi:hypothetical protein GCM10023149_48060 [Mucilaginibacter gynuensis]|uniref:Uncharacterized protein n=1 Tax=Mucilaginibacter gynuensis TaxID=1302236 RepID=A0ABP8HEV8_9SPHI
MAVYPLLLDILKYTLSGLGVVYAAFYLAKPYLDRAEKTQLLDYKKSLNAQTLPLKLQAYERVVLFVERVNPANMLVRLNNPAYSAAELHGLIVTELRNEFQHNITQQIYVSSRAWGLVKRVKDDTLSIANNAIKALPENATGLDLAKTILGQLSRLEDNPYDIALSLIRKDLEDLF